MQTSIDASLSSVLGGAVCLADLLTLRVPAAPLLLLAAWGVLLLGGFIFGRTHEAGTRRMPRWTRLGSSAALVLAALWWLAATVGTPATAMFIAIGMFFGFLGDVALANVITLRKPLLWGMGFFGVGHLAYLTAIYRLWPAGAHFSPALWGAWWLAGTVGWYLIVRGVPKRTTHYLALPYALLLSTTAGSAMALALQDSRYTPLAVGAGLFWLSDLLLGAQKLRGTSFPFISDVVWLLYGPGQMLIVVTASMG